MTATVKRATAQPKTVALRVELQDHGQDFLEWDLDSDGLVIGCRPAQEWMWLGVRVDNHARLRAGAKLQLTLQDGSQMALNYPARSVLRRQPRPVEHAL